ETESSNCLREAAAGHSVSDDDTPGIRPQNRSNAPRSSSPVRSTTELPNGPAANRIAKSIR
ncbi:MAG TPA: hypothetical protein VN579_05265, partial [Bryobacteraceae bacterium]|nr:hypothetical protein [Bryobacteraceae bacterium]